MRRGGTFVNTGGGAGGVVERCGGGEVGDG